MEFMDALRARWACKLFDPAADVTREEEDAILECGRLAPSSFGIEPWRFVSVRDLAVLSRFHGACFSQEVVRTSPLVVVLLVRSARHYRPESDFLRARSARFEGGHEDFRTDYVGYHAMLEEAGMVEEWARAQTYIAVANMMNGAAALGVDSCAIEGYDESAVLSILVDALPGFDPADWRVGIVCAFGRAAEPRRPRVRLDPDELVTRI